MIYYGQNKWIREIFINCIQHHHLILLYTPVKWILIPSGWVADHLKKLGVLLLSTVLVLFHSMLNVKCFRMRSSELFLPEKCLMMFHRSVKFDSFYLTVYICMSVLTSRNISHMCNLTFPSSHIKKVKGKRWN